LGSIVASDWTKPLDKSRKRTAIQTAAQPEVKKARIGAKTLAIHQEISEYARRLEPNFFAAAGGVFRGGDFAYRTRFCSKTLFLTWT
jgi:hypothetical protein